MATIDTRSPSGVGAAPRVQAAPARVPAGRSLPFVGLLSIVAGLAVLDWRLPGISGLELCRRLRHRDATRGLPVLMLTARGTEGDRIRGFLHFQRVLPMFWLQRNLQLRPLSRGFHLITDQIVAAKKAIDHAMGMK